MGGIKNRVDIEEKFMNLKSKNRNYPNDVHRKKDGGKRMGVHYSGVVHTWLDSRRGKRKYLNK